MNIIMANHLTVGAGRISQDGHLTGGQKSSDGHILGWKKSCDGHFPVGRKNPDGKKVRDGHLSSGKNSPDGHLSSGRKSWNRHLTDPLTSLAKHLTDGMKIVDGDLEGLLHVAGRRGSGRPVQLEQKENWEKPGRLCKCTSGLQGHWLIGTVKYTTFHGGITSWKVWKLQNL